MTELKEWKLFVIGLTIFAAIFSFIWFENDKINVFVGLFKESFCKTDFSDTEYFSVKEGQTIKFEVMVNGPVQSYNEIVVGVDQESFVVSVDRDTVTPEQFGKGILEFKIGEFVNLSPNLSVYQGFDYTYSNRVEIVQDTFGLYKNVSELYWISDMGQFNYYEVSKFKDEYLDSYLIDFADSGAYPGAYSIRPIFVSSFSQDYQLENLRLGRQGLSNQGVVSLYAEYPGVNLLLMHRYITSDYMVDDCFSQEYWYSKQNGLEKLEQTDVRGNIVMTWKRIIQ